MLICKLLFPFYDIKKQFCDKNLDKKHLFFAAASALLYSIFVQNCKIKTVHSPPRAALRSNKICFFVVLVCRIWYTKEKRRNAPCIIYLLFWKESFPSFLRACCRCSRSTFPTLQAVPAKSSTFSSAPLHLYSALPRYFPCLDCSRVPSALFWLHTAPQWMSYAD